MPIHLGSITRRGFLAGTASATAVLLLGTRASAADKLKIDPHCFALLSDTHVPADPKTLMLAGANPTDLFRKAVTQVIDMKTAPAGTIICGDLAEKRGTPAEYKRFAPMVSKLPEAKIPIHLIVGNHDHTQNLYAALATAETAQIPVVGKHISILSSPRANWFLLDSLEKPRSSTGLLGKKQLQWLAKALAEHANKPAIIMAHHNLNDIPDANSKRKPQGLKDSQALRDILADHKHVKAFIHGHDHLYRIQMYKGVHIIGLPATACTFRRSVPTAWILARLGTTGITLEFRCMDAKNEQNGKKIELTWRS